MTASDTKSPLSAYNHPLLPFGASFARRLSGSKTSNKYVVSPKAHGFNAECEPDPGDTKMANAQGEMITPGVSICFAGAILEAVEAETLVFLRELVEAMPILAPKRFYIVAVPVLLSPSKFNGTGGYIKPGDVDAALNECGFLHRALHGQNECLLVLPLYLPHEVSERTPERRIHLASRTAAFCGSNMCKTALSTPDDYAVWQVTRALMLLAGIDLSNAASHHTLLDRFCRTISLQTYTLGGAQPYSGIDSLVQRDPLSETAIKVTMDQVGAWTHTLRNKLNTNKNTTDADLTEALATEIWGDDGSKVERDGIMHRAVAKCEALHDDDDEAIAAVLFDAVHKVRESFAKRSAPERHDHAALAARLTMDVACILPRTVALARKEYDYDQTIAGMSVLWAEGKQSARFA